VRRISLRAIAPAVSGFQGLAFLRGGSEGMPPPVRGHTRRGRPTGGDGVVALSGVEGAIGGDGCDLLLGRDLVKQLGQHGGVADVNGGELGSSNLQRLLVDSDVVFAPDAPFWATVLARIPLAFALDLDARCCRPTGATGRPTRGRGC
jgi:hypothetical protein